MKLLLDTHAFLWFILDNPRLSAAAKATIADATNEILVSPASYWEIAIKIALGKLSLTQPFDPFIEQQLQLNRFTVLPIEPRHAARLITLPLHHRDPFDRLIIAQAMAEQIAVITGDSTFAAYGVTCHW